MMARMHVGARLTWVDGTDGELQPPMRKSRHPTVGVFRRLHGERSQVSDGPVERRFERRDVLAALA